MIFCVSRIICLFFQPFVVILQLLGDSRVVVYGEEEDPSVFSLLDGADHNAAQPIVSHGDLLLLGEAFYFGEDIAGMENVNRENSEVETDDEGKGEIFGKPF